MGKKDAGGDESVVLDYLTKGNRPYSLQQIVDGIQHSGIKKTACERAVTALIERGLVSVKEFGKAKIFLCRQDSIEIPDDDEMKRIDEELATMTEQLASREKQLAELQAGIAGMDSTLSTEDAQQRCEELHRLIAAATERLDEAGPEAQAVTTDEKDSVEKALNKMQVAKKVYRTRKRAAKDMLEMIAEGAAKKPRELMEEMGLEVDSEMEKAADGVEPVSNKPSQRGARARTPAARGLNGAR